MSAAQFVDVVFWIVVVFCTGLSLGAVAILLSAKPKLRTKEDILEELKRWKEIVKHPLGK